MCAYVCMYECMYVCEHMYMYAGVYLTRTCLYVHACVYVCVSSGLVFCVQALICTHIPWCVESFSGGYGVASVSRID